MREAETALSCYNSICAKVPGQPIWAVAENYRFEPAFVEVYIFRLIYWIVWCLCTLLISRCTEQKTYGWNWRYDEHPSHRWRINEQLKPLLFKHLAAEFYSMSEANWLLININANSIKFGYFNISRIFLTSTWYLYYVIVEDVHIGTKYQKHATLKLFTAISILWNYLL